MRTQKELREYLGDDFYAPLHRVVETYTQLQFMDLDTEVREELDASLNYVGQEVAQDRSPSTLAKWDDVRHALVAAIVASGDVEAVSVSKKAIAADSVAAGSESGQNAPTQSAE